jgi:hypothetical protein
MSDIDIKLLRELWTNDNIKWTTHALKRIRERKIESSLVEKTIFSGVIIKQYQDGKPHPSCLIFNKDYDNPLHIVVSTDKINIFIITAYYPALDEWERNYEIRKVTV